MICPSCGKEIADSSRFCPNCGALLSEAAPSAPDDAAPAAEPIAPAAPDPVYPAGTAPAPKGGKGKFIVIGAAAAVLVLLAAVLAAGKLLGGDKGTLQKAALQSLDAYAEAGEIVELPDPDALYASRQFSQTMELALQTLDMGIYSEYMDFDPAVLEGLGLRCRADVNMPEQELALSLTPFYGSVDVLTAQAALNGSQLCVSVPELTGGTFYGLDTKTLGQDLKGRGLTDAYLEHLSFNVFDVIQQLQEDLAPAEDAQTQIEQAALALWEAAEVKKSGSEVMDINGYDTKCTLYTVTIPQAAMEAFLDACADAAQPDTDPVAVSRSLLTSIGLPEEALDELLDGIDMDELDSAYNEGLAEQKALLEKLGDLELQVGVSGGYIMSVSLDKQVEDTRLALTLCCGGGENYVDDVRMVLDVNGGEAALTLRSSGSHAARDGVYTDRTTLELTEDGASILTAVSSLRYAPGESQDNLSWTLEAAGLTLSVTGQYTGDDTSMELHLDDVSLGGYGVSLGLRLDCTVGGYEKTVSPEAPVMLFALTDSEIESAASEILDNAQSWLLGLVFQIPELSSLFF